MCLVTQLIAIYRGWSRFLRLFGAIGPALVAEIMAFFAGLVVPITLWERYVGSHQTSHSAEAPVIAFSLIFGGILGLVTIYVTARWLWPKKKELS